MGFVQSSSDAYMDDPSLINLEPEDEYIHSISLSYKQEILILLSDLIPIIIEV